VDLAQGEAGTLRPLKALAAYLAGSLEITLRSLDSGLSLGCFSARLLLCSV
jgi:hypothetical protein